MKKTLLTFLGIALSANVWAADLKVGDKMPVLERGDYAWSIEKGNDENGFFNGPVILFDKSGNGKSDLGQIYTFCKGNKIDWNFPFAIYDFTTDKIYLDNDLSKSKNGKHVDGNIDKILNMADEEKSNIYVHEPHCDKEGLV